MIVVGEWDEDRYGAYPKPFWNNDINRRKIREARKNQPVRWACLPPVEE